MKSIWIKRFLQGFIALAFITPLIVSLNHYVFPFVVPKMIYFRILISLLLVVYVFYLVGFWKQAKPYKSFLLVGVLLFFVSFLISSFTGVDSYHSLWDNHERMLGLYTMLHYLVLYLVGRQVFTEWREWKWLFVWILVLAIPIWLIAFYQLIDPEYLLNQGSERVRSTFGNTIYVSAYAMFTAAISMMLFIKSKINWEKVLWASYAVISLLIVLLTQTRGTWLGVGVAGVVLLVLLAKTDSLAKKWRSVAIGLLAVGVLFGGTLFMMRDTDFVKGNTYLYRLTQFSFTQGSGKTRAMAWEIAVEASKEYPVFGWGPNNFFFAFNQYYNPEFLSFGMNETWFDNAHNILLNTLATQGVVGLLVYLLLFVFALWSTHKLIKRHPDLKYVGYLMYAFWIGHFVHNLFVFENVSSYLYFFLLLAFVDSLGNKNEVEETGYVKVKSIAWGVGVVTLVFAIFLIYRFNIFPAKANMILHDVLPYTTVDANQKGNAFITALQNYEIAKQIPTPHRDDIVRGFAMQVKSVLSTGNPDLMDRYYKIVYPVVTEDLKKEILMHPYDIRSGIILGQLYFQAGLYEGVAGYLVEANNIYKNILSYSPERQQIMYELGQTSMMLSMFGEGEKILLKAIELNPDVMESYWRLAMFYAGFEMYDKSAEYFKIPLEMGFDDPKKVIFIKAAADVFIEVGDIDSANQYLEILGEQVSVE